MAYILVTILYGLKYYVQNYKGEIVLNGLVNNAVLYQNEELAKEDIPKMEEKLSTPLQIMEVLPEPNQ